MVSSIRSRAQEAVTGADHESLRDRYTLEIPSSSPGLRSRNERTQLFLAERYTRAVGLDVGAGPLFATCLLWESYTFSDCCRSNQSVKARRSLAVFTDPISVIESGVHPTPAAGAGPLVMDDDLLRWLRPGMKF